MINQDKLPLCINFIRDRLQTHRAVNPKTSSKPLYLGLNGMQGVGKTTLVSQLQKELSGVGISCVVLSIDDLYRTYTDLNQFALQHPGNRLFTHRGLPGTHDLELGNAVVSSLLKNEGFIKLPVYDKSLHKGMGDRIPKDEWPVSPASPPDLIVLEGWCVGFQPHPITDADVNATDFRRDELEAVNNELILYNKLFAFDAIIHLTAKDPKNVYRWRLQQEHAMRKHKGTGMTDDQVKAFVDGYWPAYVLYAKTVGENFPKETVLKIYVGDERQVLESHVI